MLRCACVNPREHYGINTGLLQVKDSADFIIVNNLTDFKVSHTFLKGKKVAEHGNSLLEYKTPPIINNFSATRVAPKDIQVQLNCDKIRVIEVLDGELITNELQLEPKTLSRYIVSDTKADILKIVVVNRYHKAKPAVAFVKNFGIKQGAIASSVAHDSHNIIAVGVDDESLCTAINAVIECKGGITAFDGKHTEMLPLPIAGLMSNEDGYIVSERYSSIDKKAKQMGSNLQAPFMSLSFMALLVIPSLKLSDCGLFDGTSFKFTSLKI